MSKFRPKYNWKDRPVAKVLPNGDFDVHRWLWDRHWASWNRADIKWLKKTFRDLFTYPLSNTEEISGESVGDAL